jgi:hypothetical protein
VSRTDVNFVSANTEDEILQEAGHVETALSYEAWRDFKQVQSNGMGFSSLQCLGSHLFWKDSDDTEFVFKRGQSKGELGFRSGYRVFEGSEYKLES